MKERLRGLSSHCDIPSRICPNTDILSLPSNDTGSVWPSSFSPSSAVSVLCAEDVSWNVGPGSAAAAALRLLASILFILISFRSSGRSYSSGGAPVAVVVSRSAGIQSPLILVRVNITFFKSINICLEVSFSSNSFDCKVLVFVRDDTVRS